jgi:hypothetical protein
LTLGIRKEEKKEEEEMAIKQEMSLGINSLI